MADDVSRGNAKVHGEIPGVPVGMGFYDRAHVYRAGVHGHPVWGIHGTAADGAYSIVLNDGYKDDVDRGPTIIYTGQGGKGPGNTQKVMDRLLNQTSWGIGEGPILQDQKLSGGNRALLTSSKTRRPVRVIRGPNGNEAFSPKEGFRYDGLYEVTEAWQEPGKDGPMVFRFRLKRCPGQLELPTRLTPIIFWNARRARRQAERDAASSSSTRPATRKKRRNSTQQPNLSDGSEQNTETE